MMDDNIAKTETLSRVVPIHNADKCNGGDPITRAPNINGDKMNLLKLMFLYTLQGVPCGFADAFPIILKTKQFSYNDQALFSISTWPYTFKILWAPLVDSIFCLSIGRRKMWLIPVYLQLGTCLLFCSLYVDEWLNDTENLSNIILLTTLWLIINCLAATQDIVVDGWACSMLQKHNIHYASMCNATGNSLGSFMGYIIMLLLGSEEFCNKWLRSQPKSGSIITVDEYLYYWGIVYIVAAAFVFMFKSETEPSSRQKNVGVWNTYKLLWDIMKLRNVQILGSIWVTAKLGFATVDSATNMEFMGAGVSENSIAIIGILLYLVKIIVPVAVSKMTNPTNTLMVYLKYIPYRLLHNVIFAVLLYYTPLLINSNAILQTFYYISLGLTYITYQTCMFIMYVLYLSFLSQVSDPNYGGVYMTLLGTFANLSYAITRTGSLWLIDVLTFKQCSTIPHNYCETSISTESCQVSNGTCNTIIGGYYAEIVLSSILGILWYYIIKKPMIRLQSSDRTNWIVYKNYDSKTDRTTETKH